MQTTLALKFSRVIAQALPVAWLKLILIWIKHMFYCRNRILHGGIFPSFVCGLFFTEWKYRFWLLCLKSWWSGWAGYGGPSRCNCFWQPYILVRRVSVCCCSSLGTRRFMPRKQMTPDDGCFLYIIKINARPVCQCPYIVWERLIAYWVWNLTPHVGP